MTTSHELARKLLALPDLPVFACNGASGTIEEIGSPSVQQTEEGNDPADFGLEVSGDWIQIYTGN